MARRIRAILVMDDECSSCGTKISTTGGWGKSIDLVTNTLGDIVVKCLKCKSMSAPVTKYHYQEIDTGSLRGRLSLSPESLTGSLSLAQNGELSEPNKTN